MKLTLQQSTLLDFLVASIRSGRGAPTIKEMANRLQIRTKHYDPLVRSKLWALARKGYIILPQGCKEHMQICRLSTGEPCSLSYNPSMNHSPANVLSEERAAELLEFACSPPTPFTPVICGRCKQRFDTGIGGYDRCPRCYAQQPSLYDLLHDPHTWPGHRFIWNRFLGPKGQWVPIDSFVLCQREACAQIAAEIGYQPGTALESAILEHIRSTKHSIPDGEPLRADLDRLASGRHHTGVLIRAKVGNEWDHVDLACLDRPSANRWVWSDLKRAARALLLMLGHAQL